MGFLTVARFKQNSIVVYGRSDKKRVVTEHQKQNLIQNKENREYNGEISPAAQKHVKQVLENWSYAIDNKAASFKKKDNFSRRLNFITLTLSSNQEHSDQEIKRKLLDAFLIKIQRKHNVKHYIWKAELQVNGNIHFHIISDAYIHHKLVREYWNEIQEKLGYISKFEAKHRHNNPNSTDVKAIKNSKIVAYYIAKYITKKEKYKETRSLKGRIWGCSDSLRDLKYYEIQVNYSYYEDFEKYNDTNFDFFSIINQIRKEDEDYKLIEVNEFTEVHVFKRNVIDLYRAWSLEEYNNIESFYNAIVEMLY